MLKAEKQGSNIFCAETQLYIELLSEVGMSWMTRLAGKLLLSTVIVVFWSSLNANSAGSEEHLNHWHWQGHHDLPWSAKYGLQRRIPSEEGRSGYKLAIRAQLTDAVAWLRMQLLSGRQGRICLIICTFSSTAVPDLKGGTLLNGCRNCSFHFFSSQNAKSFPSTANHVHCVGLLHSFKCSSDILKE